MSDLEAPSTSFDELGLASDVLAAVNEVGYEIPSPIQAQTIPHLIDGMDLLGHAPTGTGKTAASVKDEDFVEQLLVANTHTTLLCFSNLGQVYL